MRKILYVILGLLFCLKAYTEEVLFDRRISIDYRGILIVPSPSHAKLLIGSTGWALFEIDENSIHGPIVCATSIFYPEEFAGWLSSTDNDEVCLTSTIFPL